MKMMAEDSMTTEDLMMTIELKNLKQTTMKMIQNIERMAEVLTTEDLMTNEDLKTRKKEIMNQAWRAWSVATRSHEFHCDVA